MSAAARSLSIGKVMRMSDKGAENVFARLRWPTTDGKARRGDDAPIAHLDAFCARLACGAAICAAGHRALCAKPRRAPIASPEI